MVEPITTHYPFQMSLINNGAFHFKVVKWRCLDNSRPWVITLFDTSSKGLVYLQRCPSVDLNIKSVWLNKSFRQINKNKHGSHGLNRHLKRINYLKSTHNEDDNMALMNTHKSILGHEVDVICMQKQSCALNVVNFVSPSSESQDRLIIPFINEY